jgi:hypothetical protein
MEIISRLRTAWFLPVLVFFIGCASSIDATDRNVSDDNVLTYGRINVVLIQRDASWQGELSEQLTSFRALAKRIDGRFWVTLVNQSTDQSFEPEIYNDGSFYWKLPPGKYLLLSYRWLRPGAFATSEFLLAFLRAISALSA